jgi:hypothetical protein
MPDASRMIERLPSLYRPEPNDGTLLTEALQAIAAELEIARDECSMIMPAHWTGHADRATLDPWFTLRRSRAGLPPLTPTDHLDYADARAALIAIKDAHTPLTSHLRSEFATPLVAELNDWDDLQAPPVPLQRRVLDALNRRVRGSGLYTAERFAGIALPTELVARAEANPVGAERTAINVLLLLAAFPNALRRAHLDLPWVRDLGRLGAVVPLVPWREPASAKESVESFRIRLQRMVALYRNGLGTLSALRSIVEATLPIDSGAPPELRDAPFEIEEFVPITFAVEQVPTNGPPDRMVGPLMRWEIGNPGLNAITPTLYVTGVAPGAGISETIDPMIELYQVGSNKPRIGIGYSGTVDPDATLRLRPAYATWTIGDAGLLRADHLPGAEAADPTSPGAPAEVSDSPADIVAVECTADGIIWAAADGGATLARFDGNAWAEIANGVDEIRCLAATSDALLVGTADGLLRLPLYPEDDDHTPEPVDGFAGVAVRTIGVLRNDGIRLIGTDEGLLSWDGSNAPTSLPVGGGDGLTTPIDAIHHDATGNVQVSGELGVFEYQPVADTWFWYSGEVFTEQSPEWLAFGATPQSRPSEANVFVPPVLAVHRGPDASLWMGTEAGIARYVARAASGVSFTTMLEAFPDLTTGPVTQIFSDARGGVWFCTDRGLLRYDGRDFWQRRGGSWAHLGRADVLPGIVAQERGAWRFSRANAQWQRFDVRAKVFAVPAVDLRTTAEPAVVAVMVTDTVRADIGVLEPSGFVAASAVAGGDLYLHIQPTEDRIVSGGIPYIPRLPVGASSWRYLTREPADLVPAEMGHRPAWSMEGRLFPPPPALDAPFAGRWDVNPPSDGNFDQAVYAYDPAAKVTFEFGPTQPCSVLVRLRRRNGDPKFDPAILDRVWEGIQLVRPAGIRAQLAVDETIVRGS